MNYLKMLSMMTGILLIVSCGENPKNQQYQSKVDRLTKENDSLKKALQNTPKAGDSLTTRAIQENVLPVKKSNSGMGKHPISLQWIGWDHLGTAIIKPLDQEWYSIIGMQKNKDGDYLSIDGRIKRVSAKELAFDGTIITKVKHNNNGEPCVKEGKQTFYAKGERTYFRLQNMTNCEGGMLVDYVDIYAGNSTL